MNTENQGKQLSLNNACMFILYFNQGIKKMEVNLKILYVHFVFPKYILDFVFIMLFFTLEFSFNYCPFYIKLFFMNLNTVNNYFSKKLPNNK